VRRHPQAADLREHVEQFLGNAVGKVFVCRIVAHVHKWQHRDRWRVLIDGRKQRLQRSVAGCERDGEPVATSWNRCNRLLPEDLAQRGDLNLQIVLFDDELGQTQSSNSSLVTN